MKMSSSNNNKHNKKPSNNKNNNNSNHNKKKNVGNITTTSTANNNKHEPKHTQDNNNNNTDDELQDDNNNEFTVAVDNQLLVDNTDELLFTIPTRETTRAVTRSGAENKLTSRFLRDSDEAVQKRKLDATRPLHKPLRSMKGHIYAHMAFPTRPDWSDVTSPEQLEQREQEYFEKWLDETYAHHQIIEDVSPFEHNLEVWRQLWRVLEKSDAILLLADVRNPLLHIPLAFHEYVTKKLGLPMIIVLTKCDLVSEEFASSWQKFLTQVLSTSSTTKTKILLNSGKCIFTHGQGGYSSRRKALHGRATKANIAEVTERAKYILNAAVDLCNEHRNTTTTTTTTTEQLPPPKIGIIGQPNTGKSSLVNALLGKHAVSVSRTCGHTKHWQTLNVKDDQDNHIIATLIDSPGLIFPTRVVRFGMKDLDDNDVLSPRALYECFGLYPISQIREVFSAVRFIGERIDLPRFYNLTLDVDDYGEEWTPYAICGVLADKRGYTLQRGGGAPDMHRAGLEIIYDVTDGISLLAFPPPTMEEWKQQLEVVLVGDR
jgi:ribosome biogenesis GTPase A